VREASWVVSYKGNGEATRLLAKVAKEYNQDSVLIVKGQGGDGQSSVASEFEFDHEVDGDVRLGVQSMLTEERFGGWTWFKRDGSGKTVLRAVAVPQWGAVPADHHEASRRLSETLGQRGLTHRLLEKPVSVQTLERDKGDYDRLAQ
jgi:hypothetical protein